MRFQGFLGFRDSGIPGFPGIRDSGFFGDDEVRIQRLVNSVVTLLQEEKDWNRKVVYTLDDFQTSLMRKKAPKRTPHSPHNFTFALIYVYKLYICTQNLESKHLEF